MFEKFAQAVNERYKYLAEGELYVTDVPDLFAEYLAAFPEGTNPKFRERTEHDCQTCKRFINNLGSLASIKGGRILTVWDDIQVPAPYVEVSARLAAVVRAAKIVSVFRTSEPRYGVDHNFDPKTNDRYNHLHGEVAAKHRATSPGTERGKKDAIFQVMKRGLSEIQMGHLDDVISLIDSNGLYKGEDFRSAIVGFRQLLEQYRRLGVDPDLFVWENLDNRSAGFRNTVIGTLFQELAEGKDLENAVKSFEFKTAPANYKRPTAVITQAMVEKAVETMNNLGITAALGRRYAEESDISVNDVLFVDNDTRARMKDGIALLLESAVKKPTVDVGKAVAISSDDFLRDVLPKTKSLEVFVENRHLGNFVSLTAPKTKDAARLFKWNNPFAWSYDGDVTDSVKQRVKAAGGNINAKLRVSLSWFNFDDLDLHCRAPGYSEIFYGNKQGVLDVDMNAGSGRTRTPVENLAFGSLRDGTYEVFVHQFCRRETTDFGFAIEFECDGQLQQYSYAKAATGSVPCFDLVVRHGVISDIRVKPGLVGGTSSQEKWGVKTEALVPVSLVSFSPNYWGDEAVGARHLIFALKGCKNPESIRGIYNEFLRSDLDQHRKVFEVLGSKTKCLPSDNQVSGVGFTKARGDSVTVVVDGRRSYTIGF